MKAVVQRVTQAKVSTPENYEAAIGEGLLVFLGIGHNDSEMDADWLAQKIINLRIFDDAMGVPNLSVQQIKNGEMLVISQFTLLASTKKGNRPSYIQAALPEKALHLYNYFINTVENLIPEKVKAGNFGSHMNVSLINNGPITILYDTKNKE